MTAKIHGNAIFMMTALFMLSGCASIADHHYQMVNERRAKQAWASYKDCVPEGQINRDYKQGFVDGFVDVSRGGNGTPPPVPPNRYWSPRFQEAEGLARVNCWFAGFNAGAAKALQCGRDRWNQIPACCPVDCNSCTESAMGLSANTPPNGHSVVSMP